MEMTDGNTDPRGHPIAAARSSDFNTRPHLWPGAS